ncbi:MAG: ATP-binding protein [Paludibacteraceae bacterium]
MRLYRKLFLSFFAMILLLMGAITVVQYRREHNLQSRQLDRQLDKNNQILHNYISNGGKWESLKDFTALLPDSGLRVTIIDTPGNVRFDSYVEETSQLENHKNRPEFIEARQNGAGRAIRKSSTTGKDYYYYAGKFPNYYIRSALPYTVELKSLLRVNLFFVYFMVIILLLAVLALYFITKNFTKSIDRMRIFTEKAKNGEELNVNVEFPKDELGEISSNMVMLYKQLAKTKDEVNNEREKLFNHLYMSQEGLGIFSIDKKEILANTTFVQYAGFLADKNETTSEEIFKVPEFAEVNRFIDENMMNTQTDRKRITIEKDSRYFFVQCIVFPDNTFEISINDVTTQERENELKREITQNISHELKTPVSTIMGYMESILDNPNLSKERQSFFIERSFQQAQRLSALLHDIATLNKLDEKQKVYEKEACNLFNIFQDVLKDVALELEEKHFRIVHNLHIGLEIKGNTSLLYSIFRNLIDNAIAYAGDTVRIDINCYREDDQFYYFTFADNGVGVHEEHLNRLFERFYRVDKGRSRKMGGTGLGLAIVKNAVIYHKGTITAKNTPGGGLTFVFSLKRA